MRWAGAATPVQLRQAFGSRVAQRRKAMGWSQKELARRMRGRPSRLSTIENGHHPPSLGELVRLHELLGMTLDELVTGRGPEMHNAALHEGLRRLEEICTPDQIELLGKGLKALGQVLAEGEGAPQGTGERSR